MWLRQECIDAPYQELEAYKLASCQFKAENVDPLGTVGGRKSTL